jgi:nucleotide-binding universal stress UspA family protein
MEREMNFNTILVAASGGSASDGAIELACRLTRRFNAHLEAFHARLDPRDLLAYAGDGFSGSAAGDLIEQLVEEADATVKKIKTSFEAAIVAHQIRQRDVPPSQSPPNADASAVWHDDIGYAPMLIPERARFFDLIVLGRSERVVDESHTDVIEQTLIKSGRPVLLAPPKPPTNLGESVAVGWNGSAEATRALVASLPFLAGARAVSLITIGDKHYQSVAALIEYLAWHGIQARDHHVSTISAIGPGQQLLSAAREKNADLLVMGGYGHMPWRELIFGGATREVLGTSLMPVLLMH